MYSDEDRLEIFKRECAMYYTRMNEIKKLQSDVKLIVHRLENVHSVATDQPLMRTSIKERPIIEMLDQKQHCEDMIEYYQQRIQWIIECLNNIPSPAYRALIWMTYVIRENKITTIANYIGMNRDLIYKNRKYYIALGVTDEMIAKLYAMDREDLI